MLQFASRFKQDDDKQEQYPNDTKHLLTKSPRQKSNSE